jgi:hypothetical protein
VVAAPTVAFALLARRVVLRLLDTCRLHLHPLALHLRSLRDLLLPLRLHPLLLLSVLLLTFCLHLLLQLDALLLVLDLHLLSQLCPLLLALNLHLLLDALLLALDLHLLSQLCPLLLALNLHLLLVLRAVTLTLSLHLLLSLRTLLIVLDHHLWWVFDATLLTLRLYLLPLGALLIALRRHLLLPLRAILRLHLSTSGTLLLALILLPARLLLLVARCGDLLTLGEPTVRFDAALNMLRLSESACVGLSLMLSRLSCDDVLRPFAGRFGEICLPLLEAAALILGELARGFVPRQALALPKLSLPLARAIMVGRPGRIARPGGFPCGTGACNLRALRRPVGGDHAAVLLARGGGAQVAPAGEIPAGIVPARPIVGRG